MEMLLKILRMDVIGGKSLGKSRLLIIFLIAIVIIFSMGSCDIEELVSDRIYEYQYPEGKLTIGAYKLGMTTISIDCKGTYSIHPDSLKVKTNVKDVKLSDMIIETNKSFGREGIHKESCDSFLVTDTKMRISFRCDYNLDSVRQNGLWNPLYFEILPSDFIRYKGSRVLTDTIRVKINALPYPRIVRKRR